MSENYFQHADHFKRILNDQEEIKRARSNNLTDTGDKKIELTDNSEKNDKTLAEKSLS